MVTEIRYTHTLDFAEKILLTPTCLVYDAEQKLPVQFHIGHKYVSDHPTKRGAADYWKA